nr:MAG: hypothetical protein KatS3mg041_0623 [Bacteroidota bacterium]
MWIGLLGYEVREALRGRWVWAYGAFFLLLTEGLFRFASDPARVSVGLLNVVLFIVPVVALFWALVGFYQTRDFLELILSQPVPRRWVLWTKIGSGAGTLILFFAIGILIPYLLHARGQWAALSEGLWLVGTGSLLIVIYYGIGFGLAVTREDRTRAFGIGMVFWFFTAVLYDALLLLLLLLLRDYPVERPAFVLTFFNPLDLARILLTMRLEAALLMGYTGALYERLLGGVLGQLIALGVLLLWAVGPLGWAQWRFMRRDF